MPCTLFIAGDSTAALKGAAEKPMTGWGEYLQGYFTPSVRVDNRAINGRSTKSFIDEGRLDAIMRVFRPGDYLFIQFGHNDSKSEDPQRYADPFGAYRRNLAAFIHAARERGGFPVLLTSVSRRRFIDGMEPDPLAVGDYPRAMRQTAAEAAVPLLDIFTASQSLYRSLGPDSSKRLFMHLAAGEHPNYPSGVEDDTHFSETGAREIAGLVKAELEKCAELSDLQRHFTP